jgi:hypothetical protein
VNAKGWGMKRNAIAKRTNAYASMNHLGDEILFWALERLASSGGWLDGGISSFDLRSCGTFSV